jgi:hypothetical protein
VDWHAAITDTLPAHVTPTGLRTWMSVIPAPGGVWSQAVIVTVEVGHSGTLTNWLQVTTAEGAVGMTNVTVNAYGYRAYCRWSSNSYPNQLRQTSATSTPQVHHDSWPGQTCEIRPSRF